MPSLKIASVTRASTYDRRLEISREGDARQDRIVKAVRGGFDLDWNAILSAIESASDPVHAIEHIVTTLLRGKAFRDSFDALTINGRLLAAYIQRKYEHQIGIQSKDLLSFAEPSLSTPEEAVEYWRVILNLTDDQSARILADLRRVGDVARAAMIARIRDAVTERVQNLFAKHKLTGVGIDAGDTLSDFLKEVRELLPDYSKALIETEYRTRLTTEYEERKEELIVARADVFPFAQFLALIDGRETWYACGPMGTSGPGGKGYICATTDAIRAKWRLPAHWQCRSTWSFIGYREAQRMGILAKDGKTKIALIGNNPNRPYGDPPKWATNPDTGEIRKVAPQEGFGG